MDGQIQSIRSVFNPESTYFIPPFQRQYQWDEVRWQALISDVLQASKRGAASPSHWLGILLISQDGPVVFPGDITPNKFVVIDGQQRLVTLVLWLAALKHHSEAVEEPLDFDLSEVAQITVQISDQKALEVALAGQWLDPQFDSIRDAQILKAYRYFRFILWFGESALSEDDPVKIPSWKLPVKEQKWSFYWKKFIESSNYKGPAKSIDSDCAQLMQGTLDWLSIFTLIHNPHVDEQVAVVFDTLNGMRTELEPLDHVRNSLFVRLKESESALIFKKFWEPAEDRIRDVRIQGMKPGVSFIYDFVISKGEKGRQGTISRGKGAIHVARMTRDLNEIELAAYLKDELVPSMLAWPIIVRKRDSAKFNNIEVHISTKAIELMDSIRDLSRNPANPLVLLYTTARIKGQITNKILESRLSLIENYLARQILGLTPLSPLRARIMDIAAEIDSDLSEAKLRTALKRHKWLTDAQIKQVAKNGDYGELDPSQIGAIFRGIEKSLSGVHYMFFRMGPSDYTIEHIYPKKDEKWQPDMRRWGTTTTKMQKYLNTLGNLTVVSKEHNSRVGNKKLADKQAFPSEVGNAAPLAIHDSWVRANAWTEVEIQNRTNKLISHALKNWPISS